MIPFALFLCSERQSRIYLYMYVVGMGGMAQCVSHKEQFFQHRSAVNQE